MIYGCGDLWVVVHDFSEVPWNGRVYTSEDDAQKDVSGPHSHLLYVLKLKDFMWQLKNGKPSPRKGNTYGREE
jgi:hypothetical protein